MTFVRVLICESIFRKQTRAGTGGRVSAREKADKRSALERSVIANRSSQHRVFVLQGSDNCMRRHGAVKIDMYLIAHFRERAEMMRKNDADHIGNSKFEIRSSKQCSKFETEISETSAVRFEISGCLIILICFGFRASTFVFVI